jgi:hypothetical protein
MHNNLHHAEFYQWLDLLGANLVNYSKPAKSFPAVLNPVTKMATVDINKFNEMIWYEKNVHVNILATINSLYTAYGA